MEKIKIIVETLSMMITNKCNLECPHCLRGDIEESKNMSKKVINKVFEVFKDVDVYSLCLTGGEPALNIDGLNHVVNKINEYGKSVSIDITTNGTVNKRKFIEAYIDLCETNDTGDHSLRISTGAFYPKINLSIFDQYIDEAEYYLSSLDNCNFIGMGRALLNYECRGLQNNQITLGNEITVEELCIDIHGNIYSSGNLSYEVMRESRENNEDFYIGNIFDDKTIEMIIFEFCEKINSDEHSVVDLLGDEYLPIYRQYLTGKKQKFEPWETEKFLSMINPPKSIINEKIEYFDKMQKTLMESL